MFYRLTVDAFTERTETLEAINHIRNDPRFAHSQIKTFSGGLKAALDHYREQLTPRLLIVEDSEQDGGLPGRLDSLASVCDADTQVIVVGAVNDIPIYRDLLSKGISEYLLAPIEPAALMTTIAALFSDPAALPKGSVISVIGACGGAGSSTIAHNLASSIAREVGQSTILVDLDVNFGTASLAFNFEPQQTVHDALNHPGKLDAVLLDRFLIPHSQTLRIMPAAARLADNGLIAPEALDEMLDLLRQMASYVVLDLPRIWNASAQLALSTAESVVVVAPPSLAGLRNAKGLCDFVSSRHGDLLRTRLVLNQFDLYRGTQLVAKDFVATLGCRTPVVLPFDAGLFGRMANDGQMAGDIKSPNKAAAIFDGLALDLTNAREKKAAVEPRRRPLRWLPFSRRQA